MRGKALTVLIDIGVGAGEVISLMAASAIDSFSERLDTFVGQ